MPGVRSAMKKPSGEVLSVEKNQVPQIGQENVPVEPVTSQTARMGYLWEFNRKQ